MEVWRQVASREGEKRPACRCLRWVIKLQDSVYIDILSKKSRLLLNFLDFSPKVCYYVNIHTKGGGDDEQKTKNSIR